MDLTANGLRIHLNALAPADDEDWCRVAVDVSDRGFKAEFVAFLQTRDVEYFADNLALLYRDVGLPRTAALQCVEPGISIELESDKNGQIKGKYEFRNSNGDEFYPLLSGIIVMDQSYLPEWENECRLFLAETR